MSGEASRSTSSGDGRPDLTKVFVWSMPRTLSTAFLKCMSYAEGIQIFNEPFVCAYHFGPEAVMKPSAELESFVNISSSNEMQLENAFDDGMCTFAWAKQELEANYAGKKILLVKDQAFCLDNRYELIPSGFRHAFLIRHPYRVLPSLKNMMAKMFRVDSDSTTWSEVTKYNIFENLHLNQYNLLKYIKDNVDPNTIVFDADDLQSNPGSMLSQFCQAVGIEYNADLLQWPADRDIIKSWKAGRFGIQGNLLEKEGGFYDGALMSTGFKSPKPLPSREDLLPDLQTLADESMPYYEEMLKMCIGLKPA